MRKILLTILRSLLFSFRIRADLQLEVIALRRQRATVRRDRRTRVRLTPLDRAFWILYRIWSHCLDTVVIKPETVVRWL